MSVSLEVGQVVYYVPCYGIAPVETTVVKVTPKRAYVEQGVFDRQMNSPSYVAHPAKSYVSGLGGYVNKNQAIYLKTPEILERLTKEYEVTVEQEKRRQEENNKRIEAAAKEKQERMEEVKAACGGSLPIYTPLKVTPGKTRIYTISLPVKPVYAQSKQGWEEVIVYCKDTEELDWETGKMKRVVSCSYTAINGSSDSFFSTGATHYQTEEEAIWDCLCKQYHSW